MLRIDHVVLAVRDLDVAGTRILKQVGLGSLPGGRHLGWGTENRIVPLGEEYVELLAVADPAEAESSPVGTWVSTASRSGDHRVAWCVSTDEIEGVAERLGLAVTRGSRALPDGRSITWRSAAFDLVADHPDLPFFISWDGPLELHPGRARAEHRVEPDGIARGRRRPRAAPWVAGRGGRAGPRCGWPAGGAGDGHRDGPGRDRPALTGAPPSRATPGPARDRRPGRRDARSRPTAG